MKFLGEGLQLGGSKPLNEATFFNERLKLIHRDGVTPAVCYSVCNNAYKIAQSMGKKAPLCEEGSAFMTASEECAKCIETWAGSTKVKAQDYIEPAFAQFIDYCGGINPPSATTASATLVTVSGTRTSKELRTSTVSYPCPACPMTTLSGDLQVYVIPIPPTATLANLPTNSTATPESTPKKAATFESTPNKAAIIGPVVAVGVIIIINLVGVLIWRRRRQARKRINQVEDLPPQPEEEPKYDKAQLHSDCIPQGPTYELEGSALLIPHPVPDLDSVIAEMTANEVAAQEMPAQKQTDSSEADKSKGNARAD